MGPQEDYIETVFTCEGDINDPNLQSRLEDFKQGLRDLLSTDKRKLIIKKVEPWNSVRVTFNIPREAASRLKQLAQQGNSTLRQLGVLAVQLEGDQLISLTIAGRNNERTQLIFRTADDTVDAPTVAAVDSAPHVTNEIGSPIPRNVESTRRNIADYLRQGTSLFDSLFAQPNSSTDPLRIPSTGVLTNDPLSYHASNSLATSSRSHTDNSLQNYGPPQSRGVMGYPAPNATFPNPESSKAHVGQPGVAFPPPPPGHLHNNSHMGLPPPPPYPQGSAIMNNVMKGAKGVVTSGTSPLLVNLLQNEPSLANINNFINSKMLPPPDASPPLKKKRRPRKPKERKPPIPPLLPGGSEGEISIQSVPNPALSPYDMPLVTLGSSSQMPAIPMVTQALPATTQPSVTFTTQGRQPTHPSNALQQPCISDTNLHLVSSSLIDSQVRSAHLESVQHVVENTVGKIINPITGVLEPMENLSDSSPNKSDGSLDGLSPCKMGKRVSPKERKSPSVYSLNSSSGPVRGTNNNQILGSDNIPTLPVPSPRLSSMDPSLRQHYVNNSYLPSSDSSRVHQQTSDSAFVQSSHNENVVSKSPQFFNPESLQTQIQNYIPPATLTKNMSTDSSSSATTHQNSNTLSNPVTTVVSARNSPHGHSLSRDFNSRVEQNVKNILAMSASIAKKRERDLATTDSTVNTGTNSVVSSPNLFHSKNSLQKSTFLEISATGYEQSSLAPNSEHLLNSEMNPAKNPSLSNCEADSPGGDSENSSQCSLPHDVHMQNDIGAASSEHDPNMKVYNHDSGVGSSSERSDDTPSEPGDGDYKSGHTNGDECGTKSHFIDAVQKTSDPKPDSHVITVGYAMSDQQSKHHTDISTILAMDKVLNHPKLNNLNCVSNKLGQNLSGINHQVNTVLHWSTKDKIISNKVDSNNRKSPKQFLKEESLAVQNSLQRSNPYLADHSQILENCKDGLSTLQKGHMPSYGGGQQHLVSRNSTNSDHPPKDTNRRSPFSSLSVPYSGVRIPSPGAVKGHPGVSDSLSVTKCNSDTSVQRSNTESVGVGHSTHSDMSHATITSNHYSLSNGPINHSVAQSSHYSSTANIPNCNASMAGQINIVGHEQQQSFAHYLTQKMMHQQHHQQQQQQQQKSRPTVNGPVSYMSDELLSKSVSHGLSAHSFTTASKSSSNHGNAPLMFASGLSKERKGKSPVIFGPTSDSLSIDSAVCYNATEADSSLHTQVNYDFGSNGPACAMDQKGEPFSKSLQVNNNVDQQKGGNITSKYTRKSPASSMLNSLPQQYFNPNLPLAKRLTESVQKLVKPLPFSDSSTLPQLQRKLSTSTAGSRNNPPSSAKINRTHHDVGSVKQSSAKEYIPSHEHLNLNPSLDNIGSKVTTESLISEYLTGEGRQATRSAESPFGEDLEYLHKAMISKTSVSDVLTETSVSNSVNTRVPELAGTIQAQDVSQDRNMTVTSSISSTNSVGSVTNNPYLASQTLKMPVNSSNVSIHSRSDEGIQTSVSNLGTSSTNSSASNISSSNLQSSVKTQNSHMDCKSDIQIGNSQETHSQCMVSKNSNNISTVQSDTSLQNQASTCDVNTKVIDIVSTNSHQSNTQKDGYSVECNKNVVVSSKMSDNSSHQTESCVNRESNVISLPSQTLQQDSASLKNQEKSSLVNTATSSADCSKSEQSDLSIQSTNTVLNKLHQIQSKESYNTSQTVSEPSKVKHQEHKSVVDVKGGESRSSAGSQVHAPVTWSTHHVSSESCESTDESHPPLTMTLRKRNISESSDTSPTSQHNLRPKRNIPVDAPEKESAKQIVTESESTMLLRTSRRRKTAQNDVDTLGVEPSKKAHVEESEIPRHATRSTDVKENVTVAPNRSDLPINCSDESNDSVASSDTIKSGLRARSQVKTGQVDEKLKINVKEVKRNKSVEEDTMSTRRNSQSRRGRQSPIPIQDKAATLQSRDKSPMRGSRNRGQISPNLEPHDESKRSTRSASATSKPKDATEALPPANKRRRTSKDNR